jgi:hypothetical protein
MPETFLGEVVEVEYDEEDMHPRSFLWRGRRYTISEILASWQDWGFSETGPKRKTWRTRRHQNHYVVRTDAGEFELYLDRALGKRNWILLKKR